MKKVIYIFTAALILAGCKEEQQPEVISFEELVGDNQPAADNIDTAQVQPREDLTAFSKFTRSMLGLYDTFPHKKIHTLDRFGYAGQNKLDFLGKNKVNYGKSSLVTPVASVYHYTFSDSVKTKSAFYNWLDCYGKDCNEVRLMQDIDAIKTSPMFTLVYDTTIVAVEYFCEHEENDWKQFEDSLVKIFGKDYKYRIEVDCGGPLRWKK